MKRAKAFAPASVANVAVGFDILGFSFVGAGDTVELQWSEGGPAGVTVTGVRSPYGEAAKKIPVDSLRNTAAVSLQAMINGLGLEGEFRLSIDKGIPLSSGMGGSAASAVAAVVALNACLAKPRPWTEILAYALEGERVASGSTHLDNVLPCLRGGMNLVAAPGHYVQIPVPEDLHCALIHPELEIQTRYARSVLAETTPLAQHVKQSAYLGGFIAGLWTSDWELLRATL
ncbi:MAG TPA: homoserine kinase, partial [Bdellovibrionales bacterium]|nr:homoserine kinase [Bdellovibrionales bacterium]